MHKKKKKKQAEEAYAHNPHYCMIGPDASRDEDVVSTGQS